MAYTYGGEKIAVTSGINCGKSWTGRK